MTSTGSGSKIDTGAGTDKTTIDRSAGGPITVTANSAGTSLSDGTTVKNSETTKVTGGAGADSASYINTTGTHQFDGGGGANTATVNLGATNASVTLTQTGANNAEVTVSDGSTKIVLENTQALKVNTGGGADTLTGGAGGDTLIAAGGNDSVAGGDGGDSLSGGVGKDTLAGGSGDDTLSGGGGADQFVFGGGADKITDFSSAGGDRVVIQDDSFTVSNHAGGAVVDFGAGDQITFENVGQSNLGDWYIFDPG